MLSVTAYRKTQKHPAVRSRGVPRRRRARVGIYFAPCPASPKRCRPWSTTSAVVSLPCACASGTAASSGRRPVRRHGRRPRRGRGRRRDTRGLVASSAVRRILWQPNELGLSRAYVAGEIDIEGDIWSLFGLQTVLSPRPRPSGWRARLEGGRRLLAAARAVGALGRPLDAAARRGAPARSAALARPRRPGHRPSLRRLQRLLPPLPRRDDDLLVRLLRRRRRPRWPTHSGRSTT